MCGSTEAPFPHIRGDLMKTRGTTLATLLLLATSTFAANTKSESKDYEDGSIRDVSAIGNRNVGCGKGLGNWYGLEKQIQMGREYAQQVERSAKLVNDPVVTEYVNRIGQHLVRNSDA